MSKLISGKEALIALANGEEVEYKEISGTWRGASKLTVNVILNFDDSCLLIRLKPRTITINGVEVPAPFEPEGGDEGFVISDISCKGADGYEKITIYNESYKSVYGVWKTELEIKQVVAALRSIFKPQ